MISSYVHGYGEREAARLGDQAESLATILHHDLRFTAESSVLEIGCGVGAQTVELARNSPQARFVSVDISAASVSAAQARVDSEGLCNVECLQADLFNLPFPPGSFDHLFVCFVLEHLSRPLDALRRLAPMLRPGGGITVIEGDHGSVLFLPDSDAGRAAVRAQVDLQALSGGNAEIGRQLWPLLSTAGYGEVQVWPLIRYVDGNRPDLGETFTRRTFTAMIAGAREGAIAAGLVSPDLFDDGIRALHRASERDGMFCYTFFKATAVRPL